MTRILRQFVLLLTVLTQLVLLISPLAAYSQEVREKAVFAWPRHMRGVELGARAIGHFGRFDSTNSPGGGFYAQAAYHYWYDHIIEVHATLGVGVTASLFALGAGTKLNLLEFIDDPRNEGIARGFQRGILRKIVRDFMIFASVDYLYYSFSAPPANLNYTYTGSNTVLIPGLGAQWYFNPNTTFSRRWYVESSVGYTTINGAHYLAPFLGIGCELK